MMNNLIGISGKIGSGKDTVGKMIQYLTDFAVEGDITYEDYLDLNLMGHAYHIFKFADKIKDMVCLMIGCTREQLEDSEFKKKELGEEWWYYVINKGQRTFAPLHYPMLFSTKKEADFYRRGKLKSFILDDDCDDYHIECIKLTPRKIMQLLGTECGRQIIHPNIWINATFADYKCEVEKRIDFIDFSKTPKGVIHKGKSFKVEDEYLGQYPNWIITDCRFPNEAKAIKDRGGVLIRIERSLESQLRQTIPEGTYPLQDNGKTSGYTNKEGMVQIHKALNKKIKKEFNIKGHHSETALDNYQDWDYVIDNNGTLEDLLTKVKEIYNQKEK